MTTLAENLHRFVEDKCKHHAVEIGFLYFQTNPIRPYAKANFGKWQRGSKTFYVLPGILPSRKIGFNNYVYVYREQNLRALIDVVDPNAPSPFNASFLSQLAYLQDLPVTVLGLANVTNPQPNEINIGNHIDFAIKSYTRNNVNVQCAETHLTNYLIDVSGSATRDANDMCNFTLNSSNLNKLNTIKEFESVTHEVGKGISTTIDIKQIYDDDWILAVFNLTRISVGMPQIGGAKRYAIHKNRKYLIRYGQRGGSYINVNNKKKYLKAQVQSGGMYDDSNDDVITPFDPSNQLSDLIANMLIAPLSSCTRFKGAQIIYDYGKVLTKYKDHPPLIMICEYDHSHVYDIFSLDSKMLTDIIHEVDDIVKQEARKKLQQMAKAISERVMSRCVGDGLAHPTPYTLRRKHASRMMRPSP